MARRSKLFIAVGCLLILGSLGLLVTSHFRAKQAREKTVEIVREMNEILPSPREGVMDTWLDMEMPALELDGEDFIALVDIPALGVTLPVAGSWDAGKVNSYPCRFWGTVYDGSFIVGGADQPGQFAGFDRIFDGSAVTVTDMTGAEFSYVVDRVERSKSAQAEVLMAGEADLTLFARDAYSLEYVILRCVAEAAYLG